MATEEVQSQFFVRLTSLPVVNSAFDLATFTYGRVKQVNPILDYTLSTAEKSVLFANDKAKPLVKRFEKQISLADGLAAKGLEKLEEKVPLITKPTDMIIQDTKDLYNNTIKMGVDQYETVKNYGTSKVIAVREYGLTTATGLITPYAKLIVSSVDGALSLTENCVDHYLPPLDDVVENSEDAKKHQIVERVTSLSNKIQRRVYRHAIRKASTLRTTAENSVAKYNTGLIKSTQETLANTVHNVYNNATWAWDQLNLEPMAAEDAQTIPQHMLSTARYTTRTVVSVFETAKTTVKDIPTHVNTGIASIYTFSFNAYSNLHKVQPQELAMIVFQLKNNLKLEERVGLIVQHISQTAALQWLLPVTAIIENGSQDLFEEQEIFNRCD